MKTVLVTGASGFIGRASALALAAAGYRIVAGTRQPVVKSGGEMTFVPCDLNLAAQVERAVAGTSLTVHCAYGDDALMGAQLAILLEAMNAAGSGKLIYISSIAVYGDNPAPDAATVPDPNLLSGAYARGKAQCEQIVRQWVAGGDGRSAIILRPGIVYGRGSHLWIDKFVARIKAGVWGNFGPLAQARAPLVHIDDAANGVRAAADRLFGTTADRARLEVLDLVGRDTPAWNDYFERLALTTGAAPLPTIGPLRLTWLRIGGFAAKAWRRMGLPGGHRLALAPGAGELRLFSRDAAFDPGRTEDLLGIRLAIDLDQGLRRTFCDQDTKPAP